MPYRGFLIINPWMESLDDRYDQVSLNGDKLNAPVEYLQDGMVVTIESYEGDVIGVSLPETVIMKVAEADPVVKGQTASSSYKPAVLENGLKIMVPPHIEAGTAVVVNTIEGTYVERAKD